MKTKTKFNNIYPFTTENISGYYPLLDFKDKKVLTVMGSGDHLINAYLFGAKYVAGFDKNPLSRYYSELKLAALKNLSLNEFKEFFFKESKNPLDYCVYKQLRDELSCECEDYFNLKYLIKHYDGKLLRNSKLFNDEYGSRRAVNFNDYLKSKDSYENAKGAKIDSWIKCNIINLPKALKENFDIILLSNIADYAKDLFSYNYLEMYKKQVINPLMDFLNPNGLIQTAYIYLTRANFMRTDIDNELVRRRIFTDSQELRFDGTIPHYKDIILIKRKK